jgi:hypothetical protein
MRDAVSHVVPALIFGGLGVALLWYVPRAFVQFKRTGSIRVSIRPGWTPLGEWQPLGSVLKAAVQDRKEDVKTSELRRAWEVYPFLGACVLLAVALLAGGYHYLRFGRGFGN